MIQPKLSCDELYLQLIRAGYHIPLIVIRIQTQGDRGQVEQWLTDSERATKRRGRITKRPEWIERWKMAKEKING